MSKEYKLIHSTNCTSLYCEIKYSYKINVYQKYDNVKKTQGLTTNNSTFFK